MRALPTAAAAVVMLLVCGTATAAPATTTLPVMPGVWTGAFPSKPLHDRYFINPPLAAGSATVSCVTGTCGWSGGVITAPSTGRLAVTFDTGVQLTGALTSADVVAWDNNSTWSRLSGALSGVYTSRPGVDVAPSGTALIMAQAADNATHFTVHCLASQGPCPWQTGAGTVAASSPSAGATLTLTLTFHGTSTAWTGSVAADGSAVTWNNGSVWAAARAQVVPPPPHTVHVVFMTHLDVGYNGINPTVGFIANVLNRYFHDYIPTSIWVSQAMRDLGGSDRFVWTSHPWLLDMYLDCPPNVVLSGIPLQCPSAADVANVTAAVRRGDLVYHAGPFNLQPENMPPTLFRDSLLLARKLDAVFGRNTTVVSQRDVPGMTRSAVPHLVDAGITAITVGSNGACRYPEFPKIYTWADTASNTSLMAMEHPRGYGGITPTDCVTTVDGVGLCFAFRTDNSGPPTTTDEVLKDLDTVRQEYPTASVFASTYDAFVADASANAALLPVYTNEAGDTWVYGVPADPKKNQQYRIAARLYEECVLSGECVPTDAAVLNASRALIKPPEHTWGVPGVPSNNWSNPEFAAVRNTTPYTNAASSWVEQRAFVGYAVEALAGGGHTNLADAITAELAAVVPRVPSTAGMVPMNTSQVTCFADANACLAVGAHGGLTTVTDRLAGVEWAAADAPLARVVYQTLNDSDYTPFAASYMLSGTCNGGFCKPGSNNATTASRTSPTVAGVWRSADGAAVERMVVAMAMPQPLVTHAGAPAALYLNVTLSRASSATADMPPKAAVGSRGCGPQAGLELALQLVVLNKTATRLPESLSMAFKPAVAGAAAVSWGMDKLGWEVDPMDVVDGGSQYQHAVWSGFTFKRTNGTAPQPRRQQCLRVDTVDAPVVMPTTADMPLGGDPLPSRARPLESQPTSFAVALATNVYNTNYPLWYPFTSGQGDGDMVFRFRVVV